MYDPRRPKASWKEVITAVMVTTFIVLGGLFILLVVWGILEESL